MKIASLYGKGRTVLSFEIFPPKKTSGIETIYSTIEELSDLKPDYISVTYGAGGNPADTSTRDIASLIKNRYGIEAMAHLTCVNNTKAEVTAVLDSFKETGIEKMQNSMLNTTDILVYWSPVGYLVLVGRNIFIMWITIA